MRRGGHTEECRTRLEGLIADGRKDREQQRIGEWASGQTEKNKKGEDEKVEEAIADPSVTLQDVPVAATEVQSEGKPRTGGASGSAAIPMLVPEDFVIEDAPGESSELRRKFRTPERSMPVKGRSDEEDDSTSHMRRRIGQTR